MYIFMLKRRAIMHSHDAAGSPAASRLAGLYLGRAGRAHLPLPPAGACRCACRRLHRQALRYRGPYVDRVVRPFCREGATGFQGKIKSAFQPAGWSAAQLARAVEHGQLALHYQPIVALRNGVIAGAKALLRWQLPGEFPPLPEASGPIPEIDKKRFGWSPRLRRSNQYPAHRVIFDCRRSLRRPPSRP
jgi:hypothetical protein